MRNHYLTSEHFASVTAPGWDARILHWSPDGAAFMLRGQHCAVVRQNWGFAPMVNGEFLRSKPQTSDAALAMIWRAVSNPTQRIP